MHQDMYSVCVDKATDLRLCARPGRDEGRAVMSLSKPNYAADSWLLTLMIGIAESSSRPARPKRRPAAGSNDFRLVSVSQCRRAKRPRWPGCTIMPVQRNVELKCRKS